MVISKRHEQLLTDHPPMADSLIPLLLYSSIIDYSTLFGGSEWCFTHRQSTIPLSTQRFKLDATDPLQWPVPYPVFFYVLHFLL